MAEEKNSKDWIWVLVEKGESKDVRFFAMEDDGGQYLPVFRSQEDGWAVKPGLLRNVPGEFELQAMQMVNITEAAEKSGVEIWVLNDEGRIVEKLSRKMDA